MIQQEGRFTMLHCRDNCLKNAFFNQRRNFGGNEDYKTVVDIFMKGI